VDQKAVGGVADGARGRRIFAREEGEVGLLEAILGGRGGDLEAHGGHLERGEQTALEREGRRGRRLAADQRQRCAEGHEGPAPPSFVPSPGHPSPERLPSPQGGDQRDRGMSRDERRGNSQRQKGRDKKGKGSATPAFRY